MDRLTNKQVEEFLKDYKENSETIILDEGKEKNEIIEIAKARGYKLKGSRDLAGFKTIYTFTNKANANNAILPEKPFLKALPSMVGKPVNIDHNRRYVIGHYIDYRYKEKENMAIAYGVFYKSNFAKEWEKTKKLFKSKKLATSYEIWCPKSQRKELSDGTYELLEQEIAGGAILHDEDPAFEGAKVLELAKINLDKEPEDLVYASHEKYKEEDIIRYEAENEAIKCENCQSDIVVSPELIEIKCPKCRAIIDRNGKTIYPPQNIDFSMNCQSCNSRNWLIIEKNEISAKVKCLTCSKQFEFTFKDPEKQKLINQFIFLHDSRAVCPQCSYSFPISTVSNVEKLKFTCKKCGLAYEHKINKSSSTVIESIKEIVEPEKSSEGGNLEMKESLEQHQASVSDDTVTSISDSIDVQTIKKEPVKAKKEEPISIDTTNTTESTSESVTVELPTVVANTEVQKEKEEDSSIDLAVEKIKDLKSQVKLNLSKNKSNVKKAVKKIRELKKSSKSLKSKEELLTSGIKKTVSNLIKAKEELEKAKEQVKLFEANAIKVIERRNILGVSSAEYTPEELLNDEIFEKAKVEIEKAQVKFNKENEQPDVVSQKTDLVKSEDIYAKRRKEIDRLAFGTK